MLFISIILLISLLVGSLVISNFICKHHKHENLINYIKKQFEKINGKHLKLKKFALILLLLLISGCFVFIYYNISNRIAFIRNVSGFAEWRISDGQEYLYAEADDYYSLGYVVGKEAGYKIALMRDFLLLSSISFGINYFEFSSISRKYLEYIPEDFQEELKGLSEGASEGSGIYISFDDVLIQAVFFEVLYGRLTPINDDLAACTAFGAKNKDNTTIVGQNIDLSKLMKPFGYFVLSKIKNKHATFTLRLGACPAFPIGKNDQGLTVVMNLVKINVEAPITTPLFVSMRKSLENSDNAENLFKMLFPSRKCPYGLNFILKDANKIIAVQSLPDSQEISSINSTGALVHTNRYLKSSWKIKLSDPDYSEERQEYAEKLLNEAFDDSELTDNELLDILADSPIIARNEPGILGVETFGFLTDKYFGIGTTNRNIGVIPI
ncbi:MAG: C45 family autoproteolytic acyltransferase/hydrolase [Promethearchaeota archaeon]